MLMPTFPDITFPSPKRSAVRRDPVVELSQTPVSPEPVNLAPAVLRPPPGSHTPEIATFRAQVSSRADVESRSRSRAKRWCCCVPRKKGRARVVC